MDATPPLLPLIEHMARGEAAALGELMEATGPRVQATLQLMVPDPAAAAALLEAVYSELWAHAPLYDAYAGTPWTWVMTVARAHALGWRDKHRGEGTAAPVDLDSLAVEPGSPLAGLEPGDRSALLRVFLEGLPGGQGGEPTRRRFVAALRALAEGGT